MPAGSRPSFAGPPRMVVDMRPHASASKPPPLPPSLGLETVIVFLRGETQSPVLPSPIQSGSTSSNLPRIMNVIPAEAGSVQSVTFPLIDRERMPKIYRDGRHSKNFPRILITIRRPATFPSERRLQTLNAALCWMDVVKVLPLSLASQLRSGSWTRQWNMRPTHEKGTRSQKWRK